MHLQNVFFRYAARRFDIYLRLPEPRNTPNPTIPLRKFLNLGWIWVRHLFCIRERHRIFSTDISIKRGGRVPLWWTSTIEGKGITMGKARLVKRKESLEQEQRQPVLPRPEASEGLTAVITRAIVEYRRAKKENPRQAFFDLFQQQPSE